MAVIQAPARLVPEINLCHLGRAYDIKDLIADVDFFCTPFLKMIVLSE
jgi:hypothetical protein